MNEGKSVSRKTEAGLVVIAIVILSSIGMTSLLWTQPQSDQVHMESTHKLTVWLQPNNSSFILHIDVYNTESDIGDAENNLMGVSYPIDSHTSIPLILLLFDLSQDTEGVWVHVYIQEGVSATAYLTRGIKEPVQLRDCPLEMLFERLEV